LHLAVERFSPDLIKALLESPHIDLHKKSDGKTALELAESLGYSEIALLLRRKVKKSQTNTLDAINTTLRTKNPVTFFKSLLSQLKTEESSSIINSKQQL